LEPFIDTIVICTLTALVIGVATVTWPEFMTSGLQGVAMTSDAFRRTVWWFPYPLAVASVLFAVSTMLSWSYYGMKGLTYLIGPNPAFQTAFKLAFCLFIVFGASIELGAVLKFSDAMVFVLCVPNILGLLILAPVVAQELKKFREHAAQA
jgi:AGCS family alanine or glycine:cation symporter